MDNCGSQTGWVSRGRNSLPPPQDCSQAQCDPKTDDSSWRRLNLPHDFVVEGTFSPDADMAHGYLPFGVGWYRKHLDTAAFDINANTMFLDFEGIQTKSTVWLNGKLLGDHASGYTPSRYFVNRSLFNVGGVNVLAVRADARTPDGWWYDGGGIYRHVWFTAISTPGPYLTSDGIYAPSKVTGAISWSNGAPWANAQLTPSVEVSNGAATSQSFEVRLRVLNSAGTVVGSYTGSSSVNARATTTWSSQAISLSNAALWHIVKRPAVPALYTLEVTLAVNNVVVDTRTVRFGVRDTHFDGANGFFLNGVHTKILGMCNHQDFAGVGVAIPDHLQYYRVLKQQEMGANGWRTAHNAPNPAVLDAADELGFLVWDENHRNGQDTEMEILVRRDRNHPSVIIWSLCNEVLCDTKDTRGDALRLKALIQRLDPLGNRPVSANYNNFIGTTTPLDLQGFDYSTGNYDRWHAQAPNIPSISSETSSAVSDRDEYVSNATSGYVRGYDDVYPSWGQSAQQAWGGIGIASNQGILTRPFISGGWVWTGFDYKGEPTPYRWPNINSHFGIIDMAGFPKDRFYWYQAWFTERNPPVLHLFPHWNWDASFNLPIWVFSNADEVELFVNGVSAGRKAMTQYAHVEWTNVRWASGNIRAVAYAKGSNVVLTETWRNTTGSAAALRISVKDGFGTSLVSGCADVALVQVEVIDSRGALVPVASNTVTFSVSGPGSIAGTGNGDPSSHVKDTSPTRPAFHGLVLAVIAGGSTAGNVVVSASSPGFQSVSVTIPQTQPTSSFSAAWCHNGPRL